MSRFKASCANQLKGFMGENLIKRTAKKWNIIEITELIEASSQ